MDCIEFADYVRVGGLAVSGRLGLAWLLRLHKTINNIYGTIHSRITVDDSTLGLDDWLDRGKKGRDPQPVN